MPGARPLPDLSASQFDLPAVVARVVPVFVLQVMHGARIPLAKSAAIIVYQVTINSRVLIRIVIVRILTAVTIEIVACRFDPIAESHALNVAVFRRSIFPSSLAELGLGRDCSRVSFGNQSARCNSETQGQG